MMSDSTIASGESAFDARPVQCPRCGYDQRGVIATWIDACPLEGICAECGLNIIWAEALRAERFQPQWCVEFVERLHRVPGACLTTYLRSFWPWGFWSRLKMSHPLRPRRLAMYIASLMLLLLSCYVPIQGGVAIYVRYQLQQAINARQTQLPAIIQGLQQAIQTSLAAVSSDPQIAAAQQQYTAMLQGQLGAYQSMQSAPPTINISYPQVVLEALFTPLAQSSGGSVSGMNGNGPYIAPIELWDYANQTGMYSWAGFGRAAIPVPIEAMIGGTAFAVTLMFLLPASFVLLPVSRRRAKVRWSHVGRVLTYSLFIPVTTVSIGSGLILTGVLFRGAADSIRFWIMLVACAGPPITILLWWGAAIGRYMKIPHGHFTAFVLMILCALLVLAGIWLIVPAAQMI